MIDKEEIELVKRLKELGWEGINSIYSTEGSGDVYCTEHNRFCEYTGENARGYVCSGCESDLQISTEKWLTIPRLEDYFEEFENMWLLPRLGHYVNQIKDWDKMGVWECKLYKLGHDVSSKRALGDSPRIACARALVEILEKEKKGEEMGYDPKTKTLYATRTFLEHICNSEGLDVDINNELYLAGLEGITSKDIEKILIEWWVEKEEKKCRK